MYAWKERNAHFQTCTKVRTHNGICTGERPELGAQKGHTIPSVTCVSVGSQRGYNKPLTVVIVCGAGGATLGAYTAGFKIKFGLDRDEHSRKTWRAAFPASQHLHHVVNDFIAAPSMPEEFQVDVLHLSPPCQVFSPAHTKAGKNDEENKAALYACEGVL